MRCHVCNVDVGEGQRFCHECGESLAGVTDTTQELTVVPDEALAVDTGELAATQPIDEVPALADTQSVPAADLPGSDASQVIEAGETSGRIGASLFDPETAPPVAEPEWSEPIPSLSDDMFATTVTPPIEPDPPAFESTTTIPVQHVDDAAGPITDQQAVLFDGDATRGGEPLLEGELRPFKVRPTLVLGFLGMLATLMVTVADVTDIRTDRVVAGIDNQVSTIADIGSNLAIGGFIGAALMLVGGMLHCFGLRWGAGLAGGAGLAVVGWASLVLGLAEIPIARAERITRDPETPGPFLLTVTRDLGWWLVVALAAVGVAVFAFSLVSAGTGGRRGLNPWVAAVGAVGALVVAAGPLLTVGDVDFDANFSSGTDDLPFAFFASRIGQLGLIAVTGIVGFLLVRAYGLGLAAGGSSIAAWLWLSALLDFGQRPMGVAAVNLGSSDTSPHAVTTVGIALTTVMLIVAITIAVVQRRRAASSN